MNFARQPETDQLRKSHQQLMSRIQMLSTYQQKFVLDQLQQLSRKNRFRARSDNLSAYFEEVRNDIDRLDDERYIDAYETITEDLYKKFQYMLNAIKNATIPKQVKNKDHERARRVYASKQRQYPKKLGDI